MSVRKSVMMVDAQIVEFWSSSHADVEQLNEKFNATKPNSLKMTSIATIYARRNEAVEYMFVIQNAVNLEATSVLKLINASWLAKNYWTVKSILVICLAMLVYARNAL